MAAMGADPGLTARLERLSAERPRFNGRAALVSGAASGIGEATARRLAAEGAAVVVFDVDGAGAERVAGEIGGVAVTGDAAGVDDADRAVRTAHDRFGGLDVLVCCPGSDVGSAPLLETTDEGWEAGKHVNLQTAVITTRAALPALIDRRGSIVVVSSVGGLSSAPGNTVYQTVKAGLLAFARSLAVDYGPLGVRANAVCPGWTMTPNATRVVSDFAAAMGMSGDAAYERATSVIPVRRAAQPAELAAVCAFLASPDASYITGATVVADGGTMAIGVGAAAFDTHPPA
jgi:meso-butanediol dehydrogenase / (S,S)-butanediol dehydrogenase / diacetyl reductase